MYSVTGKLKAVYCARKWFVVQRPTRSMRSQDVRKRKPDGTGSAKANSRIRYGGMNPSGVLAETGYGTTLSKGATVH